jgi:hypothetical protein
MERGRCSLENSQMGKPSKMPASRKIYAQVIATQQALQAVILELQDQVLTENVSDATKAVSYRAHELLQSLRQLLARMPDDSSARVAKEDADALQLVVDTMDRELFGDTPQ